MCDQVGIATLSRMAITDSPTSSAAMAKPALALPAKFMGLL